MTRAGFVSCYVFVLYVAACHARAPEFHGELAAAAREIRHAGTPLACIAGVPDAAWGTLEGCSRNEGRTIRYYYLDSASRVVSVGSLTQLEAPGVNQLFDSLNAEAVARSGRPAVVCQRPDSGWNIRDERWDEGGTSRTLVLAVPNRDLRSSAFVQTARSLGKPSCGDHLSLPLRR
jgi:hypothetical protein